MKKFITFGIIFFFVSYVLSAQYNKPILKHVGFNEEINHPIFYDKEIEFVKTISEGINQMVKVYLLDSIYEFGNGYEDGKLPLHSKQVFKYNNNSDLEKSDRFTWDKSDEYWNLSNSELLRYDSLNFPDIFIIKSHNAYHNEIVEIDYDFNITDNSIIRKRLVRDIHTESVIIWEKQEFFFDNLGRKTHVTCYTMDNDIDKLKPFKKLLVNYEKDNSGFMETIYNYEDSTWLKVIVNEEKYTANFDTLISSSYLFDQNIKDSVLIEKINYRFNGVNNLLEEIAYDNNFNTKPLEGLMKLEYTYYEDNVRLKEFVDQHFSKSCNCWQNRTLKEFYINNYGDTEKIVTSRWNKNKYQWTPVQMEEYIYSFNLDFEKICIPYISYYDSPFNKAPIEKLIFDYENDSWVIESRQVFYYSTRN